MSRPIPISLEPRVIEGFDPDVIQISEDDIGTELDLYSMEPEEYTELSYDNRNFPGRSQPSEMKALPKFAPAGFTSLMSKPEDLTLNTLLELQHDLFDVYRRPLKGLFGAMDGAMEASEKPFRTNSNTVAKALSIAFLPANVSIGSAQGFLQGFLKGERGAAEVLHRLGVKNPQEKLSKEDWEKRKMELAEKTAKARFGLAGPMSSKIVQNLINQTSNHPLETASDMLEDPLIMLGPAKAIFKNMLPNEAKVLKSIKLGAAIRKEAEAKLGKDGVEELSTFINQAKEKGQKGVIGLLDALKTASPKLQTKLKEIIRNKRSYEKITDPDYGQQLIKTSDLFNKLDKSLPIIINKQGNKKARELMKMGYRDAAIEELMQAKTTAYMKRLYEDPIESAVLNASTHHEGRRMIEMPAWVQDNLFKGMKRFGPINKSSFDEMTLNQVLNKLPKTMGKIARPQETLRKLTSDKQFVEILSKDFNSITPNEMEIFLNKFSEFVPKQEIAKAFSKTGYKQFGERMSFLNDPQGFGNLNWKKWIYEEAGLADDFLWPRINAKMAENADREMFRTMASKALKSLNKNQDWNTLSSDVKKRLTLYLNTKNPAYIKNDIERKAAEGIEEVYAKGLSYLNEWRKTKGLGPLQKPKTAPGYINYVLDENIAAFGEKAVLQSSDINPVIGVGFKHMKQRKGFNPEMEGLKTDVIELLDSYINGVTRLVNRKGITDTLANKLEGLEITPAMKKWIQQDLNQFAGEPLNDKMVDFLVKGIMKTQIPKLMGATEQTTKEQLLKWSFNLLQYGYASGMGLNFRMALRNLTTGTLGIPRTSFSSYIKGNQLSAKWMMNKNSLDPEMAAFSKLVQESPLVNNRIGDISKMVPDIGIGGIYKSPLQSVSDKLIAASGFTLGEKQQVLSTYANSLYNVMERKGIKSLEALSKRPDLRDIVRNAEKLVADIDLIYEKMMRPAWTNNVIGSHLLQYGSFGGNMMNLFARDLRPTGQEYLIKSILQQSLLAMTLTAGGLAGMAYAPYFGAVEPLKQLLQVSSGDANKAIRGPALRAGYGGLMAGVGLISGDESLRKRGKNEVKKAAVPAIKRMYDQSKNFKDPSRYIFYKPFPKGKKKR